MASKFACAWLSVGTSAAIGCVDGCWSAWYPDALRPPQNVVQESVNQVAEPHVRHLVQDDHRPGLVPGLSHPGPEHQRLGDRDAARVFHRAGAVGHEHLVVLGEWV